MKELSLSLEDLGELDRIRASFKQGRLQIIVGAGASMAAGLPGWGALNASLIADYFNDGVTRRDDPKSIGYEDSELEALSDVFANHFGKNAVIDLLRDDLEEDEFYRFLHRALYEGKSRYDLQPLHFELAAAVKQRLDRSQDAHLYTFNYDDVLERALHKVTEEVPESITGERKPTDNSVVHFHGYLPLESDHEDRPTVEGEIVLSEKDYHRTRGGNPDHQIEAILADPERDLLLLGTSLSDPRLRRLLYRRLESAGGDESADPGEIWVVMARKTPSSDADLATRRAERMAANHVKSYWRSWDVDVVEIETHEVLPTVLRAIRLGEDVTDWMARGRDFLREHQSYEGLYSESRQARGQLKLIRTHEALRQRFEVSLEEDLTLSFFVPTPKQPRLLQPAFRFSDPHRRHTSDGDWFKYPVGDAQLISPLSPLAKDSSLHLRLLTESEASQRRLEVSSVDEAEGATGLAVATGGLADARDADRFFRNFSSEKRERWDDERTYSSLLSIPVYDTQQWVPIGAACIASVNREPFWDELDSQEQRNLERLMRTTFRNLLEYETRF